VLAKKLAFCGNSGTKLSLSTSRKDEFLLPLRSAALCGTLVLRKALCIGFGRVIALKNCGSSPLAFSTGLPTLAKASAGRSLTGRQPYSPRTLLAASRRYSVIGSCFGALLCGPFGLLVTNPNKLYFQSPAVEPYVRHQPDLARPDRLRAHCLGKDSEGHPQAS
jgi:hypothetical protein